MNTDPTDIPALFSTRAHTPPPAPSARALAGTLTATPAAPTVTDDTGGVIVPELPAALQQAHATLTGTLEPAPLEHATPTTPPTEPTPPDPAQLNWATVQQLRLAVTEAFRARTQGSTMQRELHQELLDELILDQIADYNARALDAGRDTLDGPTSRAMSTAVMAALLGAGRLQPLLDLPDLEDLQVEGYDNVWLQFADGRLERGPHVADSDDELIAEIQQIARTNVTGEKQFSPAHKKLRMALPDGSRLAAEAWMTPRPSVTVRKHRFVDTDLDQIQALGSIDASLTHFLAAAMRAGKSMMISGSPAAGKTTLARAILNALDPQIRIATIETQYELFLHQMPDRHYRVWSAEAQEGGEPDADGRIIGRFTLSDLVEAALQKSVERIVIGEVVGDEVVALLEAFQAGNGGLSTIHAHNANDTVERLITLVTRARSNVSTTYAGRLVAQNIDLIVHINSIDERHLPGGRMHRFVDEIVALDLGGETHLPVQRTTLYAPDEYGRAVPTGNQPVWIDDLTRHGFTPAWLTPGASTWAAPPNLLIPYSPRRNL